MKALELADWLIAQANCEANEIEDNMNAAAAELRRLAEVNAELLAAFEKIADGISWGQDSDVLLDVCHKAIAKAKEQQ